jgi:hypothetical protein
MPPTLVTMRSVRVLHRCRRPCSQPWRVVWTVQRHKAGGRRPGDSRGAVHAKRQGVLSTSGGSLAVERKQNRWQTQIHLRPEFQSAQTQ